MNIVDVERKLRVMDALSRQIEGIETEYLSVQYALDVAEALELRSSLSGGKSAREFVQQARGEVLNVQFRREKAYELMKKYTGLDNYAWFRIMHREFTNLYNLWQEADFALQRTLYVASLADDKETTATLVDKVATDLTKLAAQVTIPDVFNLQEV